MMTTEMPPTAAPPSNTDSGEGRIVNIKCEGAACNGGTSAQMLYIQMGDRHGALSETLTQSVTKLLKDTPHRVLSDKRAKCINCGHERVWG